MMAQSNPSKTTAPKVISLSEDAGYFRAVFESAAIGMALVGLDGKWLRVNPSLCDLLGRSEEELLALNFQRVTHPDDLAVDREVIHRLLEGAARSYTLEKRYLRKDGQVVWVLLAVALLHAPDGTPSQFIAQIQDISERK